MSNDNNTPDSKRTWLVGLVVSAVLLAGLGLFVNRQYNTDADRRAATASVVPAQLIEVNAKDAAVLGGKTPQGAEAMPIEAAMKATVDELKALRAATPADAPPAPATQTEEAKEL